MNATTREAGPPVERAAPDVTKRPVPGYYALVENPFPFHTKTARDIPMAPPMAIICICRDFSFRARPELAVLAAAAAWSKWPRATVLPFLVMVALGSRLKLSTKLVVQGGGGAPESSHAGCSGAGGEPAVSLVLILFSMSPPLSPPLSKGMVMVDGALW